jgi:hypothetical protein
MIPKPESKTQTLVASQPEVSGTTRMVFPI